MTKWERRCRRESQQKYRKLGPSPATILENTQVVLAVECGYIGRARASKILRTNLPGFEKIRDDVIAGFVQTVSNLDESPCQQR